MPKMEFKRILVQHFRGISNLSWLPSSGMNVIIGGGDTGKTTILDAIGLLLHPTNGLNVSETDFFDKDPASGFLVEAVVVISDFDFAKERSKYWPWLWTGDDAVVPDLEGKIVGEPVFKIRVAADEDFEIHWNFIQPDGDLAPFSPNFRRRLGLVKLSGDDRNDRDLRLVYGSALHRLISDRTLRAKIADTVAKIPLEGELDAEGSKSLLDLDTELKKASLPSELALGLVPGHGNSIGSLVGLHAMNNGKSLPLTSWGAGTRRMTSLKIAAQNQTNTPMFTIDEVERGLEPYRLKRLLANIEAVAAQSFITTHSPIALANATNATLWYLDATNNLGELPRKGIAAQQERDPETFLWKIPIIVEGATEVGFVNAILKVVFGDETPLDAGVRVSLGQGDDQCLELLRILAKAGISCAGFVDNEGKTATKLKRLKKEMGDTLFHWADGCLETNVIAALPDHYLQTLFLDRDGDENGYRLRTVATRLGIQDKSIAAIKTAAGGADELRKVIIAAAIGDTVGANGKEESKSWKKHSRDWFKTADGNGGRELLNHIKQADRWKDLEPTLRPFFNAIMTLSDRPPVRESSYERQGSWYPFALGRTGCRHRSASGMWKDVSSWRLSQKTPVVIYEKVGCSY